MFDKTLALEALQYIEDQIRKNANTMKWFSTILRGPINQDEYKSYVTPLLFFKRLSDYWIRQVR